MFDIHIKKEIEWKAFWIHDPIFKKQPIVQPIDAKRSKYLRTEIHNRHTLFRKEFEVKDIKIKSAKLYVTADDCYKAYINGQFIAYGPAQAFCFSYNYNVFEIKKLLKPGINTLAFHVFYQGMLNMALISADNLNGMICMLNIEYADGYTQMISSDSSFKCYQLMSYTFDKVYGYETQFAENIDLNYFPYGWNEKGFDDSGWITPFISSVPYPMFYNLNQQITPTVSFEKFYPEKIVRKGKGHYLLDFGQEICGNTTVTASGKKGQVITIWHGEELDEDNKSARHNMRCGCDYEETITLSGNVKSDKAEFFDFKAFRYIEVFNFPGNFTKKSIYVNHRHYPIPKNHALFETDNTLFEKIWKMCEKGIIEGTQESYIDCPTREKGAFLGDGLITGLSHLCYTNDERIMKKFLYDCISSARLCPGLFSTTVTYDASQMIDYSLVFPIVLNKYFEYTNDIKMIKDSLNVLEGIISYYAKFYEPEGILGHIKHVHRDQYTVLVDWPVVYRDGYDDDTIKDANCFGNLAYLGILKETIKAYSYTDNELRVKELTDKATQLEQAIINAFYDYDTGLFNISRTSSYHNFHDAVFALYFELNLPKGHKPLLDYIKQRGVVCGVYFTYYYFSVLYRYKEYDKIFDLMISNERNSWKTMLSTGATTCIEAWHPDDKLNCSLCHPWSSTPMIFNDIFYGISSYGIGYEKLQFKPRIPKQLNSGKYTKPTPLSDITVSFERKGNKVIYHLTLKKACRIFVCLSDKEKGHFIDAPVGITEFVQVLD